MLLSDVARICCEINKRQFPKINWEYKPSGLMSWKKFLFKYSDEERWEDEEIIYVRFGGERGTKFSTLKDLEDILSKMTDCIKVKEDDDATANSYMIGGSHYKNKDGGEEHWDRMFRLCGPGYFIGSITKYVERYRKKDGLKDLLKAKHFIEKLIELEEAKADLLKAKHFIEKLQENEDDESK